jgi:hypothetical protein
LFDVDKKKLPRAHQYFAIKAAQKYIKRYECGMIWHTQGSQVGWVKRLFVLPTVSIIMRWNEKNGGIAQRIDRG